MRDGKNDAYHVTNPPTERKQVVRARDATEHVSQCRDKKGLLKHYSEEIDRLRDAVKQLQDIKRINEAEILKMAHQVDVLNFALERIRDMEESATPWDYFYIARKALNSLED